ncbi:MAG: hypothetical protein WC859_10055 [Elusimicrobiota bacterium]|jgi:hypothetical protein
MAKMLRHKETGELFIYTALLAKNDVLEAVPEDPVKDVIAEVLAEQAAVVETVVEAEVVSAVVEPAAEDVVSDIDAVLAEFNAPAPAKVSKKKAV